MGKRELARVRRDAGELIARKRVALAWSQKELARRCKVTQSGISHVEQGRGSPMLTLQALRTLGRVPRVLSSALLEAMR